MKILIKKGRVIDPAHRRDEVCDILLQESKIAKIGKKINATGCRCIDAQDKVVLPGLVDMHAHLREPGREDQETIATATGAALKGGITSVLAMPNTNPAIDCAENITLLRRRIAQSAKAHVFICAAITQKRKGEKLVDITQLKKEGAVAISDDGSSVDSAELLRTALLQAKTQKLLVICHCEDNALSAKGCVNLGIISTRMGLRGISKESEYARVQRDIELAQSAKAHVHIAHVSCKESVELISRAKKKGFAVSAETAPHYFSLSEDAVAGFNTNMKMNPPLRTQEDVIAIRQGLKDGSIDAIASDHAPHTESEKDIEFERAHFGVIGLETELAVGITELVERGILSWTQLVEKLATNPARILGINKGTLGIGCDADLIVVAPGSEWLVQKSSFVSKSKNSPFIGRTLKGIVEYTLYQGKVAYQSK